jgi:hypothetical protein
VRGGVFGSSFIAFISSGQQAILRALERVQQLGPLAKELRQSGARLQLI